MREIALHILDICQNSITAKATVITVDLAIDEAADTLEIVIADNGCGMSKEMLQKVTSPFTTTRTTRKVGLGIPLFKAGCEATGGSLTIESEEGKGTKLTARYSLGHIDRPPLGQLAETIHLLVTANPDLDFYFKVVYNHAMFELDTVQLKDTLQGVPLNNSDVSAWILGYLQDGLTTIFGGNYI
jgi:anti-sigma regulatory factor (Ser/Thr protein kinase)